MINNKARSRLMRLNNAVAASCIVKRGIDQIRRCSIRSISSIQVSHGEARRRLSKGPKTGRPLNPQSHVMEVSRSLATAPSTASSRTRQGLLLPRPPVVTVMGHVDHGKTTLLDSLRNTSVASQEAGGITQHIGAFSVCLKSGKQITFLDTPGHSVFSAMRARGANVTDIVVLVVAADDGVKAQTLESIKLVEQSKVPIVVAINKCDKYGVNVSSVKRGLLQHGVQLEDFGGDVQAVEISALKSSGLDALEEAILAQADLCEITADYSGPVKGVVIESKMAKNLGPVATVLVQQGTLLCKKVLVASSSWGKVRLMQSDQGTSITQATPSTPVLVCGWKTLPNAGDLIIEVESEKVAKKTLEESAAHPVRRTPLRPSKKPEKDEKKQEELIIPVVVKGDVAGTVEAIMGILNSCPPRQLQVKVIHSGVGPITENDIELLSPFAGIILAFNLLNSQVTATLAKRKKVKIIENAIIYKLFEELKEVLEGYLPPVLKEEVFGEAVVIKTFQLTGTRKAIVGGCRVESGRLLKNGSFRLIRDGQVINEELGKPKGMMHERESIEVARKDTECGLSFSTNPDFELGDCIQSYKKTKVSQMLHWDFGF